MTYTLRCPALPTELLLPRQKAGLEPAAQIEVTRIYDTFLFFYKEQKAKRDGGTAMRTRTSITPFGTMPTP